jgi:hypothetical protein
MWLYVDYESVSAFGLRPSNTTANGGKSLICPTPYAIKMALLDRLIRDYGLQAGRDRFPDLRDLVIHLRLPPATAINRTFQKVQRGWDGKTLSWTSTIAQREYCFQTGAMTLALDCTQDNELANLLAALLLSINSFGRRGSFFQAADIRGEAEAPTATTGFVDIGQTSSELRRGFLQRMDDMLPTATFDDVSTFNPRATGARRSYTVIFPYRLAHHGYNHTVYERMEMGS